MLTIDEPPPRPVCAQHGRLEWGYFLDTKRGPRWVSWTHETVPVLGAVLVPHVCDDPDRPPARWEPNPAVAERAHRHMDLIREERGWAPNRKLGEKAQERTEEGATQ